MENVRMFKIKYLGATNTLSSRVKITDTRNNKVKTISFNHKYNNSYEVARGYLLEKGIVTIAHAWDESTGEDFLFTKDFETQIKVKE